MSLVKSFVPPSVQARLIRKGPEELPTLSLKFNYKVSPEIVADIDELESFGFHIPVPLSENVPSCFIEAPEPNIRDVVCGLNSKHRLTVYLEVVQAGSPPTSVSFETLEVQ